MKQQVTLALSLTLAAGLLAGCADTTGGEPADWGGPNIPCGCHTERGAERRLYRRDEDPPCRGSLPEDGADSVERLGDHADSPYFAHPDYYHMQSSDTPHDPDRLPDHAADQRMGLRRHQHPDGAQLV